MSVIQSTQEELRYLKKKNLDEESRVIGNYYRDLIRSFGIDCHYYKLNLNDFNDFKQNVDNNAILKKAYGYDDAPSYDVSADMITYAEIQTDIFQLNKYGLNPQTDVEFAFDSVDFACALAPKVGQFKEYKIDEQDIYCEVPPFNDEKIIGEDGREMYLSSFTWPYELGLGMKQFYKCDMLSGKFQVLLSGYELDKEQTVVCNPYEHVDFFVEFPANSDLYRSLSHKISNVDYLETLIYLTFKVTEIQDGIDEDGKPLCKYVLTGKIHGSVLFFDLASLGKYVEMIHPMVGDLVTIDFPDENNRERYEITDCYDKQLTQDGINPLLHKYIWKCKARRFIDSYTDAPEKCEGDERIEEKHKYDAVVNEEIAKKISLYNEIGKNDGRIVTEDAAYGGYSGVVEQYDKQIVDYEKHEKFVFLEDAETIDLLAFGNGSKLVTTGYDLVFVNAYGDAFQITAGLPVDKEHTSYFADGMRFLKATDSQVVFVNIEGESTCIAIDQHAVQHDIELCLNALHDVTIDTSDSINKPSDNFYKFKGTKTYLWSTKEHLFVKLASNGELYCIV